MSLPVEIVFGIYLGIITGIVPALVAGVLGFVFKYVTDVTIPGSGWSSSRSRSPVSTGAARPQ